MRLCDAGIVPCMLVHDAVLIEADNEEQIAHAVEIMKSAGRDVCDGFEIGVDVETDGARETLPRQAPGGDTHVGSDDAHVAGDRGITAGRIAVSNRRMVTRHGKTFEVETLDFEPSSPKRRRAPTGQRFAMLTEERLKLLARVLAPPPGHLLLPPNGQLEGSPPAGQADESRRSPKWEFPADAKCRALPQLERAGFGQGQKGRPPSADRHSPEIESSCREIAEALSRNRGSSVAKSRNRWLHVSLILSVSLLF